MADVHKYYCTYCHLYIFGETAARLASHVNTHNTLSHPADCANWNERGIVMSAQYSESADAPSYLVPYTHSKEWGDAKPPEITDQDRAMLAQGHVKW